MALSLETTIVERNFANGFPSGYTAPATTHTFDDTSIDQVEQWTIPASGVSNATTASTGLTALVSAVDTYCSGTYVPNDLSLDTTATINMVCTILKVKREITTSDIFVTGTDNYIVDVKIEWQV